MYNFFLYSVFFKNWMKKVQKKRKKSLSLFLNCFSFLKYRKIRSNIFFFLILIKLKPIFYVFRLKPPKKKKIRKIKRKVFFKPKYLRDHSRSFKVAVTWFLLPFSIHFQKTDFFSFFLFSNCFLLFLDFTKFNTAIYKKKKVYLKCLYSKKFFRLYS